MCQSTVLFLVLCAGTLVQPFRIAEAEPGHHQGCLRTAMAPDGHFAVAWLDSLQPLGASLELDLYIRFFDPDGSPLTDAYKITKVVDTNLIRSSHLDMDSAGSTVLLWTEYAWMEPNDVLLRLQLFDTSGSPLGSPQTDHQGYMSPGRAIGVSLNNQGGFAVAWDREGVICARRYSFQGGPQGDSFVVHGDLPDDVYFNYPGVALSDAGDLVVTWLEFIPPWPRFQVFDAEDEPILGWEPMGHLVNEDSADGTRVEAYWLDNDRFVLFWIDHAWPWRIAGRVFADRGLTRYPICRLVHDTLGTTWADPAGRFAIALSSDERFAETHIRSYSDRPDTSDPWKRRCWDHGGAILGYIQDNEPIRWTNLFEYTPPLGADTVNSRFNNWHHVQPPAVACSNDRLVWVYSRLNTDTIFEAYAMITDWDMGEGVEERPVFTQSPIRLSASLNRLSYDILGEAKLTLYSADGRRILEETIQGKGTWTPSPPSSLPSSHLPAGVYFARVEGEETSVTRKVVLIR